MKGELRHLGRFWAVTFAGWRGVSMTGGAVGVIGKHWICE